MAITKTKKQSTPAVKPKSIPERIQELKDELNTAKDTVENNIKYSRTKYKAKEYTDAFADARKKNQKEPNIDDFVEEPAQPALAFYSQITWLSQIKSIGSLTEKLIFDVELNGEGKQDAKTLVSAFRLAFLRLKKTCETKPIDLLGVRENIRKYKELLETAQAHFAEPKIKPELQDKEPEINIDNVIFNSSQSPETNRVKWNKEDPNFIDKKEAIKQANHIGDKYEIIELQNMKLTELNNILRKKTCTIQYMSKPEGRPEGRVHKGGWTTYLEKEIQFKTAVEEANEKNQK